MIGWSFCNRLSASGLPSQADRKAGRPAGGRGCGATRVSLGPCEAAPRACVSCRCTRPAALGCGVPKDAGCREEKRVSPGAVKSEHQENTKSLLHQFLRNSSRKKPTGGQAELTGSHAWTGAPLYRAGAAGDQWGAEGQLHFRATGRRPGSPQPRALPPARRPHSRLTGLLLAGPWLKVCLHRPRASVPSPVTWVLQGNF